MPPAAMVSNLQQQWERAARSHPQKRISPRPCPCSAEDQAEVTGRWQLEPEAGGPQGCSGLPPAQPWHPNTRLGHGVCAHGREQRLCPPLQNSCPWERAAPATPKRMREEKQGSYRAVPTAPSSRSNSSIAFPPPQQRKGFKESWDAGTARHPSASGMPADLDFVSCCFRPRARIHPEKTPHNTTE